MNNVYIFKTSAQVEKRGKLIAEINELSDYIEYLESLVVDSPLAELGIHERVESPMIRRSILRANRSLRKEIAILKGRRTRLENEVGKI